MKRLLAVLALAAMALNTPPASAQMPVGAWRDCLDYTKVFKLQLVGNKMYVAGRSGTFCYNTDSNDVKLYSKSHGTNDVGVADIGYDDVTGSFVIVYENSNVDIIQDEVVFNVSDIKRSSIAGDKSIYNITFRNGKAWLATGFGIVVVDLVRHEISETYYLGAGGTSVKVHDVAFTSDSIYAATADGIKRVSVDERYPSISDRWDADTSLAGVMVTEFAVMHDTLWMVGYTTVEDSNTLYVHTNTGYIAIDSGNIQSLHMGGGMMTVSYWDRVTRYRSDFTPIDTFTVFDNWAEMSAYDAVTDENGVLWVAHTWMGLLCVNIPAPFYVWPDGPRSEDKVYKLASSPNGIMLCPGGHTSTYANTYLQPNLHTVSWLRWRELDKSNGALAGKYDVVDAVVNPNDTAETLIVCWGLNGGVASVRDNHVVKFYDQASTGGALQNYTVGTYTTLLVGAATFDKEGNLWVLNSHSSNALVCRNTSGVWSHVSTEALASLLQVDKLIYDSINGFFWFTGRENMIYVHDGSSRMAKVNPNNGSKLVTEAVNCIVQDMDGNIWIGTNKGIKVIYDASRAFANGGAGQTSPVNCSNITITNGDFYEYLMAYENVTSIVVDGANRKWVGTASGGLYLLSSNGMEQLRHFTAANSPLFSDKIVTVAIQPRSGEVYMGTDYGVQTYRSDATYAELTPDEHVYAFPNPVRPGYEGKVAIKGFTRDALVHITDAAGHVVFTTQALGGQAVWDIRTADGQPVAAGVYYVFASDAEGKNRSVTKILVMR